MRKRIFLVVLVMAFGFSGNVLAADLVTTLHKTFEQFQSPYEEVTVGIEVITKIEHQEGAKKRDERAKAEQMHDNLIHVLYQNGWEENSMMFDDITAQKMEMIIGYRMKVFVHECEFPGSEYPYRGEDLRSFFSIPVEKLHECLLYKHDLK